ncbi:hypothetical protein [Argonema antarcticum]|uniref:hypothetical protein n=1 Tax=Argonema antarcticum TaxID=2942763 RepID=UPI002013BE41|nr:hypothetical protein [Argonema antarcticum]MCL1475109.1 hypothetical protein [Argonema antarcticum A004/B2]
MNKTYPVVLYPNKILKFLATNPTTAISSDRPTANQTSQAKNLPKQNWFMLTKSQLMGAIAAGVIIAWSLAFLSPFWLVVITWIVILLGVLSIDIPKCKQQSFKRQKVMTSKKFSGLNYTKPEIPLHSTTRSQQLSKLLSGSVMSSTGMGIAQIGVSEKDFKQVLQQIFPNIQQGLQFQNPDLSIPYSADFTLIHPSGLSIDIEVDEPYVGNTKEPHHCTDGGKDNIRNEFFLKGNWAVIRFSEKQVVQYSRSCCKVIASVIARVTGDRTYLAPLQTIPDLPTDPMWTTRQAQKWAKENYRQTYLPVGRKK